MQRDQPPRDRQPQANSACASAIFLKGDERLKNALLLLRGNAFAGILHPQMEIRSFDVRAERDLPLCGEFPGVVQQIVENLAQTVRVSLNQRQRVRNFKLP